MPRYCGLRPMGCSSGVQGLAVGKRQAPVKEVASPGEHRRPRGKGGTHPGRISIVWNVVTPTGSGPDGWSGRPTVRKAESLGGDGMTREANAGGRKAAGNRDRMIGPSADRSDTDCPQAAAWT